MVSWDELNKDAANLIANSKTLSNQEFHSRIFDGFHGKYIEQLNADLKTQDAMLVEHHKVGTDHDTALEHLNATMEAFDAKTRFLMNEFENFNAFMEVMASMTGDLEAEIGIQSYKIAIACNAFFATDDHGTKEHLRKTFFNHSQKKKKLEELIEAKKKSFEDRKSMKDTLRKQSKRGKEILKRQKEKIQEAQKSEARNMKELIRKMKNLDPEMGNLDADFEALDAEMQDLDTEMGNLNIEMDDLSGKLDCLEVELFNQNKTYTTSKYAYIAGHPVDMKEALQNVNNECRKLGFEFEKNSAREIEIKERKKVITKQQKLIKERKNDIVKRQEEIIRKGRNEQEAPAPGETK